MNALGFVGFGKMAYAIAKGVVNSSYLNNDKIFAYDINKEFLDIKTKELKINSCHDIKELMNKSDAILIATKPFVVNEVINEIAPYADNKLIISILAGIPIKRYEDSLVNSRIIRVMPNTPAMVNEGMSVICRGSKAQDSDTDFVYKMFLNLGKAICLDETLINAVTAVSGSGPAFYYYIIDKIAQAGEYLGLPKDVSLELSAQTALGAAKMIMETKTAPNDLIKAVTTPNGTTAEGNKVLIESDIEKVLFETVNKTCQRAIELGK
mgnify:CR=1 FL=1